jgi:hypothetical protein
MDKLRAWYVKENNEPPKEINFINSAYFIVTGTKIKGKYIGQKELESLVNYTIKFPKTYRDILIRIPDQNSDEYSVEENKSNRCLNHIKLNEMKIIKLKKQSNYDIQEKIMVKITFLYRELYSIEIKQTYSYFEEVKYVANEFDSLIYLYNQINKVSHAFNDYNYKSDEYSLLDSFDAKMAPWLLCSSSNYKMPTKEMINKTRQFIEVVTGRKLPICEYKVEYEEEKEYAIQDPFDVGKKSSGFVLSCIVKIQQLGFYNLKIGSIINKNIKGEPIEEVQCTNPGKDVFEIQDLMELIAEYLDDKSIGMLSLVNKDCNMFIKSIKEHRKLINCNKRINELFEKNKESEKVQSIIQKYGIQILEQLPQKIKDKGDIDIDKYLEILERVLKYNKIDGYICCITECKCFCCVLDYCMCNYLGPAIFVGCIGCTYDCNCESESENDCDCRCECECSVINLKKFCN